MTMVTAMRKVATYERVSSEDQRERETIKTQTEALERRLALEDGITLVERYADDGVSGMKRLGDRPQGSRLLRDAAAHTFGKPVPSPDQLAPTQSRRGGVAVR